MRGVASGGPGSTAAPCLGSMFGYALLLSALAPAPTSASPNCLKDHKAFNLAGDSIKYSTMIAPGADCIQGLRWSYMQIYAVMVLEKPKRGELVMVGSGFRYFAKSDFTGTDKFSLVVVGTNRHAEGYSTVEITVSASSNAQVCEPVRFWFSAKNCRCCTSPLERQRPRGPAR
jgi:hypothetical protein